MSDPVNHPAHYNAHPSGIEAIEICEHLSFCLGNVVKYLWRAGQKGDRLEDLKKARWYLDRERNWRRGWRTSLVHWIVRALSRSASVAWSDLGARVIESTGPGDVLSIVLRCLLRDELLQALVILDLEVEHEAANRVPDARPN